MNKTKKISLLSSQIVFFVLFPIWIELTKFLHPLVIGIVWLMITSIFIIGASLLNKEKIVVSQRFLHVVLLFYSFGLLILLFFRPNRQNDGTINLIPFDTIRFYLNGQVEWFVSFYNIAANIGLFIPYGLYYIYVSKKPNFSHILFITICSICSIEILQFMTKTGSLDIDDLILNVFGVCIGYLIHPFFRKVLDINNPGD